MSREIVSHLNDTLLILAIDEPGNGNACHIYDITPTSGNAKGLRIEFQNGLIQEVGINGLSNEVLLSIVEDRLLGFQSGEFACRENAVALTKLQESLMWLQKRTRDRMARGVEGTHVK